MMNTYRTNDPHVAFFYILLRDHLPAGTVETIMEKFVEASPDKRWVLTNEHTARHAQDVVDRLVKLSL